MYYLITADGTSLFAQAYPKDFLVHCLAHLIDTSEPLLKNCRLLDVGAFSSLAVKLQALSSLSVPDIAIFNCAAQLN